MTSILCFNDKCIHNDNMYTDGSGYCLRDKVTFTLDNDFECADVEYNFDDEN